MLSKKQLEIILSKLKPAENPKPSLEQYTIPSDLAAEILNLAHLSGDIKNKIVFDLGCGTGRLALGALLMGAKEVVGVDIDDKSLDVAEENIQPRIRGMILMAFANKFNRLVLSCGNKSEMAMGYATLYGDLAGGLAAISDISKSQVYEIARWINNEKEVIPCSIIDKAPSAELKPDQKDSDTLPDYDILDAVIEGYVEHHLDAPQIAEKNKIELALVQDIIHKIHLSEYKRQQAPIGLKVTQKAFSVGRQFPIVHRHSPE